MWATVHNRRVTRINREWVCLYQKVSGDDRVSLAPCNMPFRPQETSLMSPAPARPTRTFHASIPQHHTYFVASSNLSTTEICFGPALTRGTAMEGVCQIGWYTVGEGKHAPSLLPFCLSVLLPDTAISVASQNCRPDHKMGRLRYAFLSWIKPEAWRSFEEET